MRDPKDTSDNNPSLEQFAKANRDAFDELEAIDEKRLWQGIQSEPLSKIRPISGWKMELGTYWKWSAAACIAIAVLFGINYATSNQSESLTPSIATIYPDLRPTQVRYQQFIKQKEAEINLPQIDKDAYTDIFYELKILDEIYAELLAELPTFSDQEKVKEILLRYYERKLKTLEILSKEIKRKEKQERHEEQDQLI
ncbi:MAG: hypothetical protein Sapg2KO_12200 [Saprospiraceae bacterium]